MHLERKREKGEEDGVERVEIMREGEGEGGQWGGGGQRSRWEREGKWRDTSKRGFLTEHQAEIFELLQNTKLG